MLNAINNDDLNKVLKVDDKKTEEGRKQSRVSKVVVFYFKILFSKFEKLPAENLTIPTVHCTYHIWPF